MNETKRTYDRNGWLEVKDNPASKVGVFDYLGAEINAPDPSRIYRVYRPEEKLRSEETINSFGLMPFILLVNIQLKYYGFSLLRCSVR